MVFRDMLEFELCHLFKPSAEHAEGLDVRIQTCSISIPKLVLFYSIDYMVIPPTKVHKNAHQEITPVIKFTQGSLFNLLEIMLSTV